MQSHLYREVPRRKLQRQVCILHVQAQQEHYYLSNSLFINSFQSPTTVKQDVPFLGGNYVFIRRNNRVKF